MWQADEVNAQRRLGLDCYLSIAETVLRAQRRPLSSREILKRAYLDKIVPSHLFGRTQHKTLGARLSEDILLRRERSSFFRTNPGRFFLREFLTDKSLPEEYRSPMVARRRERDLQNGAILAVDESDVLAAVGPGHSIPAKTIYELVHQNRFHYAAHSQRTAETADVLVWSFVVVFRSNAVLSYRIGRYRDGRDTFLHKRSIGFFRAVRDYDRTLFEQNDHGIVSGGLRAATLDLDLPQDVMQKTEYRDKAKLVCALVHQEGDIPVNLLGLVLFECPEWFEPTKRKLAINDLGWLDLRTRINYLDDFDPWSKLALAQLDQIRNRSPNCGIP